MAWPKETSAKRYPSDLTDEEWEILKQVLDEVEPYTTGRPRKIDLREVLNAIYYMNKTGCQWRYLPKDFPSYSLVSYYYQKWVYNKTWGRLNTTLRQQLRKKSVRDENPSAGIIDTQSVKGTPESTLESGFDGGKLIKGRKRHIVVYTIGYILIVVVHAANIYDGTAAREVLKQLFLMVKTIKRIWADGTYASKELIQGVKAEFQCVLEVVNKQKTGKGFQVLPRRWVVERTFGWLSRSRRLSKDYERNPNSSASMVYVTSSRLMLRQLCKETTLAKETSVANLEWVTGLV
jgi:putative transposase